MKKPRKTASLKEQQAYWYKVLKKEGFVDIEDTETGALKSWAAQLESDGTPKKPKGVRIGEKPYGIYSSLVWKESQATYYRMAGHFLHEHKFESVSDMRIWKKHAEGRPMSAISREHRLSLRQVSLRLAKLKKIMFSQYL